MSTAHSENPNRSAVIISVVFLIIVLSYGAYVGIARRFSLSGTVRYSIGVTDGIQLSASGRDIKYVYSVNGKTYRDVTTYAYSSQQVSGRYFVKFSVEHPEHSELYQNRPVPEHIIEASPNGWATIPR